jgi:hypothetical protein
VLNVAFNTYGRRARGWPLAPDEAAAAILGWVLYDGGCSVGPQDRLLRRPIRADAHRPGPISQRDRHDRRGITGIYTDPRHVILYTSDGETRQEFSILLTARLLGGEPTPSSETSEVRWVRREDLAGYRMDRSMRLRIGHYLDGRTATSPYLG